MSPTVSGMLGMEPVTSCTLGKHYRSALLTAISIPETLGVELVTAPPPSLHSEFLLMWEFIKEGTFSI